MKIAIVAEPYVPIPPPQYGGIEQVVAHLVRGLKEAGHKPILLAPGDSKVDCELIPTSEKALWFPTEQALSLAPLNAEGRARMATIKRTQRKTEKLLRDLLSEVDIVHSHGFDLAKFSRFPNLTTLHNPIEFSNFEYYLQRKELYYASISKNYQSSLPMLNYAGVVYNGEDPREFPIVEQPEDYVCFLGRFDRDKNPHMAIKLAIALGVKIKLAGKIDDLNEEYFEKEIRPYLKHRLVEYMGELGFDEKVELISNARCNLHPVNFREPFGLAVVEAAYCGTPTLAISRGSMPELIEQGRTGYLVEDFMEGVHQLAECFTMDRQYIASRARQLFNYKSMTKQYIELYERIIGEFPEQPEISSNENIFAKLLKIARHPLGSVGHQ